MKDGGQDIVPFFAVEMRIPFRRFRSDRPKCRTIGLCASVFQRQRDAENLNYESVPEAEGERPREPSASAARQRLALERRPHGTDA